MAIRVGSAGLKYPLPNYAEIGAQRSAAAASAGGSATSAAYGANRRYAGQQKQLQYDALQAGLGRQFQAGQAFVDRGFRAEQAGIERTHDFDRLKFMANERETEARANRQTDRDLQRTRGEQAVELDRQRNEYGIDEGIQEGLRRGELELPPAVERKMRELDAAYIAALELEPEQRREYEAQAEEKKRQLLRQAQPRRHGASETWNRENVFVDPTTGVGFDEPGEGRVAYDAKTGKPRIEQQPQVSPAEQWATDLKKQADLRKNYAASQAERLNAAADDDKRGEIQQAIDQEALALAPNPDKPEALKQADASSDVRMAAAGGTVPAEHSGVTVGGRAVPGQVSQRGGPGAGAGTGAGTPTTAAIPSELPAEVQNILSDPAFVEQISDSRFDGTREQIAEEVLKELSTLNKSSRLTDEDRKIADQIAGEIQMARLTHRLGGLPQPQTKQERDSLPKGMPYVGPDGTVRTKS